jgi:hypothetical protein
MGIEMACFNKILSVWEPVVEKCDSGNSGDYEPWNLFIQIVKNENDQLANVDSLQRLHSHSPSTIKQILPSYSVVFRSETTLQIVLTRTFLDLIDSTVTVFTDKKKLPKKLTTRNFKSLYTDSSMELDYTNEDESSSSILIKNQLGLDVSLTALSGFRFWNDQIKSGSSLMDSQASITLKTNRYCSIILSEAMHSIMRFEDYTEKSLVFSFTMSQKQQPVNFNVTQCGINGYYAGEHEDLVVCESISQFDKKRIYLRSGVQVRNYTSIDLVIEYKNGSQLITENLPSNKHHSLPLNVVNTKIFSIKPAQ